MGLINQYSRISHHTVTTTGIGSPGQPFTVPATEDFTTGSWTATDLALSEFGVNEFDRELFIRIDDGIYQIPLVGSTPVGGLWEAGSGLDSILNTNSGNIASGIFSLATGYISTVSGDYSFTGGGFDNTVTSYASATIGGENGQVIGNYSAIIGGLNNYVSTVKSVILGGDNNSITASANQSVILGGNNITATAGNTAYVPYLNIGSAFVWAGTETDLLIRNSSGEIKLIPISALAASISGLTTDFTSVSSVSGSSLGGLVFEWFDPTSSPGIDPKIVLDATGITFDYYNGDYYTFPAGDGAVDQVMVTDGAGQLSWTALVYENTSTNSIIPTYASGNNSITGSTFSVISSGTDNSIVSSIRSIIGGGGGVATGNTIYDSDYAFIGAGSLNEILAGSDYSTILSGENNEINGSFKSFIGAGTNSTINVSENSAIVGGIANNIVSSNKGFIGAGSLNEILAGSDYSFIGGGRENIIIGSDFSIIVGGGGAGFSLGNTITNTEYSFIGGGSQNSILSTSTRSFIGGGYLNIITGSLSSVIVGGGASALGNSITSADYAFIGAGRDNIISTGADYAFIGGGNGNDVSATSAVVVGGGGNTASASGAVVVGGGGNTASASGAVVVGGDTNTASAFYSFVGAGQGNTASGIVSAITGGLEGIASRYGQRSFAAGKFGKTDGSAQQVDFVMRNATTNATPTQLFLDGASLKLTVTSGTALACSINVCGIEDDGTQSAHYMRKVLIKNVAGTTALVGTVQTIGTDVASSIFLDVTITANNTDDTLDIEVTGLAATNMNWVAHVSAVEIIYAA